MTSKKEIRDKINQLNSGLPQDWLFINRKIRHDLSSTNNFGVKGPINLKNQIIRDSFQHDLAQMIERKAVNLRPIIGENGSGKTTHLEYVLKPLINDHYQGRGFFLYFDFRYVAKTEEEFWRAFFIKLYEQMTEHGYLSKILAKIPKDKERVLRKLYGRSNMARHIINAASPEDSHQSTAEEFFYADEFPTESNVRAFYSGFLKAAFFTGYFVVLAFDELQHLSETCGKILTKKVLEKFVRATYDTNRNNPLYIVLSCLQNEQDGETLGKEYDELKRQSRSFADIVRNREIVLGKLTSDEFDEILKQSGSKAQLTESDSKRFMREIKANIEYYAKRNTPRELVHLIYQIFEKIGYLRLTKDEIRTQYEQKAREFMIPKLSEKGFYHIYPEVRNIGRINFDIYAEAESQRTLKSAIKRAFGEAKSVKCKKRLAEDYVHKMRTIKDREYRPSRGDYVFLISPEITKEAKLVLKDENIDWILFNPLEIQEYLKASEEDQLEETPIFARKTPSKYSLKDVTGIGAKTLIQLKAVKIESIEDLINCNPKLISEASKIGFPRRIGEGKIIKFQQIAKELLEIN